MTLPGDTSCVVYVARGNGHVLYVGVTSNLWSRMRQHDSAGEWMHMCDDISFTRYSTRTEALAAESAAIRDLQPLFNKEGSTRPFIGPAVGPVEDFNWSWPEPGTPTFEAQSARHKKAAVLHATEMSA